MEQELPGKVDTAESVQERLPVLPVGDMVLFPYLVMPIDIKRPASQKLVDDALMSDHLLVVVAQKQRDLDKPGPGDLFEVGTLANVMKLMKQTDGSYQIIVRSLQRVRLNHLETVNGYWVANVEKLDEDKSGGAEIEALVFNLRTQFEKFVELANLPAELGVVALNVERPIQLAYIVASNLNLTVLEQQTLLELPDLGTTLERTTFYLARQIEKLELVRQIRDRVRAGMDKRQREYFLREQLRTIKGELGESDERNPDIQELLVKLEEMEMPQEARVAAEKEIERMARMAPNSSEYTVSRNYLDWLLEMPWSISTRDTLDVRQAAEVLDQDHFDLEKVKKRVLEYLAVLQLKQDMKGPILCFVGPPGVGKTSLGQSIARSLGRKFLRLSLGGLRDEAEIRGHRRTYVGALPGRIVQGLKRVGSNNPVFVLDEIDKVGTDFRGDPSSALLEVLDPEQNFAFSDHYLGVPLDLSRVLFIATANMMDTVPSALRDRMEVIEIPGYTEEEKLEIARRYLVVRQIEEHGLINRNVVIGDEAILEIIRSYTREAGVRSLNRNIASLCRSVAREIAEGREGEVVLHRKNVGEILGPVQFIPELSTRSWGPGISTGLAWTPSGGDLIFIETLKIQGHGKLTLTGQLGEVMKESAAAALTYIRARAVELGIQEEEFEHSDIHVHVPAGAVPKDGPSAGVALVVALASLMSGRRVRRDVAMTGEITLRGDVLPVGGIKEKVLAARRAGIKEVLIPHINAKDLVDIPVHLRSDMVFRELQVISEALELALEPLQSS